MPKKRGRVCSDRKSNGIETGGRTSHGATLLRELRELRKPSAALPRIDAAWVGHDVRLGDGRPTPAE
ncbi:hypothetical protein CFB46_32655 [Burkholderia sp. HI2761]|nr:hypothetical protein [Burkholderia sp. BE24]OXJ21634.1 hypothetical protein CFB46_32655 [Burkholderia sp. HI2761]